MSDDLNLNNSEKPKEPYDPEVVEAVKQMVHTDFGEICTSLVNIFNGQLGLPNDYGIIQQYLQAIDISSIEAISPELKKYISSWGQGQNFKVKVKPITIEVPAADTEVAVRISDLGYLELSVYKKTTETRFTIDTNLKRLRGGVGDLPFTHTFVRSFTPLDQIVNGTRGTGFLRSEYNFFSSAHAKDAQAKVIDVTYPLGLRVDNSGFKASVSYGADLVIGQFYLLSNNIQIGSTYLDLTSLSIEDEVNSRILEIEDNRQILRVTIETTADEYKLILNQPYNQTKEITLRKRINFRGEDTVLEPILNILNR